MSDDLKPCPFCGGHVDTFFKKGWHTVECNGGCLAAGPMKRTEKEAVEAWNKRFPDKDSFDAGWEYRKLLMSQTETDADIVEAASRQRSELYWDGK